MEPVYSDIKLVHSVLINTVPEPVYITRQHISPLKTSMHKLIKNKTFIFKSPIKALKQAGIPKMFIFISIDSIFFFNNVVLQ